jgi:succinate dehydrogenase/fumarate reductase flavoprotein subunit
MKSSTAIVIVGGGIAALWAVASMKSTQAEMQPAIDASIKKTLADIAKMQAGGKSTP